MSCRFWGEYVSLVEFVQSGRLGKPLSAMALRLSQLPAWADWFVDPALSGGAVLDLSVHDFDALNWVLGTPKSVYARGQEFRPGLWNDIHASIDYGDANGFVEGSEFMPTDYPFTCGLKVLCEGGVIEFRFQAGGASVEMGGGSSLRRPRAGKAYPLEAKPGDAYENQAAYFVACVREGRAPELGTPEQARLAVRTANAAQKSFETGRSSRSEARARASGLGIAPAVGEGSGNAPVGARISSRLSRPPGGRAGAAVEQRIAAEAALVDLPAYVAHVESGGPRQHRPGRFGRSRVERLAVEHDAVAHDEERGLLRFDPKHRPDIRRRVDVDAGPGIGTVVDVRAGGLLRRFVESAVMEDAGDGRVVGHGPVKRVGGEFDHGGASLGPFVLVRAGRLSSSGGEPQVEHRQPLRQAFDRSSWVTFRPKMRPR